MGEDMSKIKKKSIDVKSKEMEETRNHDLKETFDLDKNNLKSNVDDENNSKKSNDMNKNLIKLKQNYNNFSILDILSIISEKN